MEQTKIKVGILPNQFLKADGTFDKNEAIMLSGKFAGVCYDEEGFEHLINEPVERTMRRIARTLNDGHHSVYDHILINFNLQNLPKILAMVLNNEHQYTTSEKSARYTPVVRKDGSIITEDEERLYNKWLNIFKIKIKSQYGYIYGDSKIQKLAQENARYLVTVFMPTQMIYSTSFRQINYIASWMQEYIKSADVNLDAKEEHFGDVYSTLYKGSLAEYAQAQRHRTLDYQMEFLDKKEYYIPPIIADDQMLVDEWLGDMQIVREVTPQGELVKISEVGKYEDFILKCKERLCSGAQLEIAEQTRETLLRYKKALEKSGSPLAQDIQKYSHGARCTFPDFDCTSDCKFTEGKKLVRKI